MEIHPARILCPKYYPMPRAKLARKSTSIDMTAMCDVAFLLLSYFIIVAHSKKPEAIEIQNPGSVYTKITESKNVVMVTLDKEGKVYFSISDPNTAEKASIINEINDARKLGLTEEEKNNFIRKPGSFIAVPFARLKSFLGHDPSQLKSLRLPGIPVTDTLHNELTEWVSAAKAAFTGSKMNILVNGDNSARYPSFGGVLTAMKKNDEHKFGLVTSPVAAPAGSELAGIQAQSGNKKVE